MKERILITVKTYPVLSRKHAELVCTAGVTELGECWRLYPVKFRQLQDPQKYRKYQWVEAYVEKSESDNRPESYKIIHDSLKTLGEPLPPDNFWSARKAAFLEKVEIHTSLDDLIARAHANEVSLAAFRPARILKFDVESVPGVWDADKLAELEREKRQLQLFDDEESVARQFAVVEKIPYKFSYQFEDCNGRKSKLMIEDWEIGNLFRNCCRDADGDEAVAVEKVRAKYWGDFVVSGEYDVTLILGTTLTFHRKKAPNPFVIIGVFYPKMDRQGQIL